VKGYIAFAVILGLFLFALFMFDTNDPQEEEPRVRQARVIPSDKFGFAREFRFSSRMVIDGEVSIAGVGQADLFISPHWYDTFTPFYDQLVFVHSEDEAVGFPDNVIVAWPEHHLWLEGIIIGFHQAMAEPDNRNRHGLPPLEPITPERLYSNLGLTYPLTIADFVDNWEQMLRLWQSFTTIERPRIRREASRHYREHRQADTSTE